MTLAWLDFVDDIALELGFVEYDTKGEYAGYTSANPPFRTTTSSSARKNISDSVR